MKVVGADKLGAKLRRMPAAIRAEVDKVNADAAAELVRIAKLLHPGDGETRAHIEARQVEEGWLVDFGDKAKVTEGDSGPRPHINPALKVTRKKHEARAKRAVQRGVKRVFGGG